MTIEEFLAVIDDKQAPAPLTLLDAFEAEIEHRLPEDYRDFLIRCNGGYAAGSVVFQGPTPDGSPADACPNHIGGFRDENYFSLQWARMCYQSDEELRIPKALLWIMDDPCGNAICIGLSGKHREHLYFWDHENEPDPEAWDGEVETAGNIDILCLLIHRVCSRPASFRGSSGSKREWFQEEIVVEILVGEWMTWAPTRSRSNLPLRFRKSAGRLGRKDGRGDEVVDCLAVFIAQSHGLRRERARYDPRKCDEGIKDVLHVSSSLIRASNVSSSMIP
jgi:hypothetical protein